jgi:hypothetical protein
MCIYTHYSVLHLLLLSQVIKYVLNDASLFARKLYILLKQCRHSRQSNSWKTFEMISSIFSLLLTPCECCWHELCLSSVRKPSTTHPSQQHMKANSYQDTAPTFARTQSVIFLSVETLKTLVYTATSKIN